MSIYGPNFSIESMSDVDVSSTPKTFSFSGFIDRQNMATIIPLIHLSNYIPFKKNWMPSYYQPFFDFSVEPRQQLLFIDTCFIFAKRILGRNNSYSIANKLKNSLSSETWTSGLKHAFSRNEQVDLDFNFGATTQQLECGLSFTTLQNQNVFVQATLFGNIETNIFFDIKVFIYEKL